MKKTFTSLCCLAAMGLNAQNQFIVSPIELNGAEISLFGEALSDDQMYVVGQDQNSSCPAIWNTVTGDIVILVESELLTDEPSGETYMEDWTGAFHAVNNNGQAVGAFGAPSAASHAILWDAANPDDYEVLYEEDEDAGNVAYGISDDGSTIVGFHFDAAWVTYGCVWTENGTVRTDLPWPTEEECGFAIDYASVRGMSADGNVIMGYVQDNMYGAWVMVCWERQADGSYAVNAQAANKYFEFDYQLGKPYMTFEPTGLSKNGEWVTLRVVEEYDPFDWSIMPMTLAARLNVKTNELEVLGGMEAEVFGVANDGTAVGRITDENWLNHGVVWYAGAQELKTLDELLPESEELAGALTHQLCTLTSDGSHATGVLMTEEEVEGSDWPLYLQYAFVTEIPAADIEDPVGIKQLNTVPANTAYDMMGRRVMNTHGHITIVNGKKNITK